MKQIPEIPNYWITTDGVVWFIKGKIKRTIKIQMRDPWRKRLEVKIGGRRHPIHRLLAKTYLDNPDNKPMVLHRNDDSLDNRLENLYWGDAKDNVRDAKTNGRRSWRYG